LKFGKQRILNNLLDWHFLWRQKQGKVVPQAKILVRVYYLKQASVMIDQIQAMRCNYQVQSALSYGILNLIELCMTSRRRKILNHIFFVNNVGVSFTQKIEKDLRTQ